VAVGARVEVAGGNVRDELAADACSIVSGILDGTGAGDGDSGGVTGRQAEINKGNRMRIDEIVGRIKE